MKIAIVGGGPGGYVAAIRAAQLGAQVTIVEQDALGGTCLNVGCIPTKALLHSAQLYQAVKEGAPLGIIADPVLDFDAVQTNKRLVSEKLVKGIGTLMRANKIEVIKGSVQFKSKSILTVITDSGARDIKADKIILATGSIPMLPKIPGLESERCLDSTAALNLKAVPYSLVIIGGGVIGVELATAYRSFGSEVAIVEMLPEILPMADEDTARLLRRRLTHQGIKIHTGAKVVSVEDDSAKARVNFEKDGTLGYAEGEYVLVCIGRKPNTAALLLDNAGIAYERGAIKVDKRMRTNIPNIYAIGDCTGGTMLAHVASAQGEVAAEHALGFYAAYNESTSPACIYTDPEIASVGLTEKMAQEKGIPIVTGTFPFAANGKSLVMNSSAGFVKIVADAKYTQVLGVHIIGKNATDLIAEAALAIRLEATVDELISTIHAHPTLSEAMREAALDVKRRAIHILSRK